jgi:flavin reductase (DIM6/NTAB) family NADH-FMN oxidoreductase RutF
MSDTAADLALAFKGAMRRLATTVSIVSTRSVIDDLPMGMTATAVTSLTTDPPALLVCVNRSASIHSSLTMGRPFCINLLAGDHGELSFAFGGKVDPGERFAQGSWHHHESAPYLADAQSNLFCVVDGLHDYGTHTIVIGRVESVRLHGDVRPLIFGDGRFIET